MAEAPPVWAIDSMDSMPSRAQIRDSSEIILKHLLKSIYACAVVLSILLTTSYSGFLQPPKPLTSGQNSSSTWQILFIYFNGSALFSSVAGLLFFGSSSFSPLLALDTNTSLISSPETEAAQAQKRLDLLANLLPKFFYVIFFFGVSLTSSVLAYIFAGFSTVGSTITEQTAVIVPAVIGGFVYLQALWVCLNDTSQLIQDSLRQNQKLWEAMKSRTWFGLCLGRYIDVIFCDSTVKAPIGIQNSRTQSDREENAMLQSTNGHTSSDQTPRA